MCLLINKHNDKFNITKIPDLEIVQTCVAPTNMQFVYLNNDAITFEKIVGQTIK